VDGVAPGLYGDYSGTYCEKGSAVTALAPLETTPGSGTYNDASLAAIDGFLGRLYNLQPPGQDRIKAIISPHNANALTSGTGFQDIYGQWYGTGNFYTDSNAIAYYKERLAHIINYKSPWFGVPWKNLTYMILGFDIQNEPMNEVGDPAHFSGNGWLCNMAEYMRSELGSTNQIKIVSGGFGGGTTSYNLESPATGCAALDVIALHGYQSESSWANYIPSAINNANGKLVIVEEWGVGSGVSTSQWSTTCNLFNSHGVPWVSRQSSLSWNTVQG
jgi:mannan endo-1,4-beta-mannosidase